MDALKERFRPEFLNRIDEFVTFGSLGVEQLRGIVGLELRKVADRLHDKELHLRASAQAESWLALKGLDPVYVFCSRSSFLSCLVCDVSVCLSPISLLLPACTL
jgi:ATP-dependent Clp protease ATP-binding subunit ClpA